MTIGVWPDPPTRCDAREFGGVADDVGRSGWFGGGLYVPGVFAVWSPYGEWASGALVEVV